MGKGGNLNKNILNTKQGVESAFVLPFIFYLLPDWMDLWISYGGYFDWL